MDVPYRSVATVGVVLATGLFAMTLVTGPVFGQPTMPDKAASWTYVGNSQCKVCHNNAKEGGQWEKWHTSKHTQALDLLKSDEAKAVAEKAGLTTPPAESPECLKCHVTGYDVAAKAAPAKISLADGVQCESCHGPASEHLKDAKILKFTPEKISEIDVMAHKVAPDEQLCRGCHNDTSPTWKADRYTTAGGEKVGFDYKQALEKIAHDYPAGVMEDKYGGKYPVD